MNETKDEASKPPSSAARDLWHRVRWFFIVFIAGVTPAFVPLVNIMPFQIKGEIIPLSAVLMGIVAQMIDYSAQEKISRQILNWLFWLASIVMVVGFFWFVALRINYTVSVPRGRATVVVMIGDKPRPQCPCWKITDPVEDAGTCVKYLTLDSVKIASCWGRKSLNRVGLWLSVAYPLLTAGLCGFVGLGVLQARAIRRDAERRRARRAQSKGKKEVEKGGVTSRRRRVSRENASDSELPPEAPPEPKRSDSPKKRTSRRRTVR